MYGIVITVNNTLLQAYFVFTVFCRYRGFFLSFFLLQSQGLCQLGLEQVYRGHISNSICSLGVSVTRFGKSPAISKIFILIIFVMMT